MAEAILAIVGVAIAVPGVVVSLAQCGDYLIGLVRKFSTSAVLRAIELFGRNLHDGRLKMKLQVAEAVWKEPDIDDTIKLAIEDILVQLQNALILVARNLSSFLDHKGGVRRVHFALSGERRSAQALQQIQQWQVDFDSLIDLVERKRRLVPEQLLLSRDNFRAIRKPNDSTFERVSGTSIYVFDCEHKDRDTIQESKCLLETRFHIADAPVDEIKAIAAILAKKLSKNNSTVGVLQCIGFRNTKEYELVFKLPDDTSQISTLASMFRQNSASLTRIPCLATRLRLCRQLCEALLAVHASGLVHKSVRSDSVLLIRDKSTANANLSNSSSASVIGSAYLCNWSMLRKITDLSSRRGSDDWKQDVYRHPRRQGLQPEERYHIGHDLYSLGVVMIEIILWESLLWKKEKPPLSQRFVQTARNSGFVKPEDITNVAKLTAPLTVKQVLTRIAQTELDPIAGPEVAAFIVACLTCLEGGFLNLIEQDFKNASNETVLQIREVFLRTFP